MTSRKRILAAWEGRPIEPVPLTAWCFGVSPPPSLRWERASRSVRYWYSLRMEYIHTFPEPWELADDFQRVKAWQALGVDDLLEVSVPWSMAPEVEWTDHSFPAGSGKPYPVLVREYRTPEGMLRHAVRQTDPEPPGWVSQPPYVPLFEDLNIPRAVEQAVSRPAAVPPIRSLYAPPDAVAQAAFAERMASVHRFATEHGVAVQAWSAFGMDAVVWLMGTESAVLMALDEPQAFGELVEIIAETDYARTELALDTPGVDLIVQRGWYSSTDFWSPALFDRYVAPPLTELARRVHARGRKLAYVMTTGVETLGPRLADAGVDVLYFVDPVQDQVSLSRVRETLGDRLTLAGGLNALTLSTEETSQIREEVYRALDTLGDTGRFILQPVDALFPDTPWEGVEAMIAAWKEYYA